MFEHLSSPTEITESNGRLCTRKASGALSHSADRSSVVECSTRSGAKVYLCAGCLAAFEAWRWLRKSGTTHPGQFEIRAAVDFLASADGYAPPVLRETSPKLVEAAWRLMRQKERQGLVRATGKPAVFSLVRDSRACLDCRQIRGHLAGCMLVMNWPERSKERLG